MDDIALADNPGAHRFELTKGGAVAAYAEYNLLKDVVMFTHTEALPADEGQGLGSKLAKFALDGRAPGAACTRCRSASSSRATATRSTWTASRGTPPGLQGLGRRGPGPQEARRPRRAGRGGASAARLRSRFRAWSLAASRRGEARGCSRGARRLLGGAAGVAWGNWRLRARAGAALGAAQGLPGGGCGLRR